jgi:hypothetical protein
MLTRARMYNVHVHKATARRQRPNRTPTHRNLSTWDEIYTDSRFQNRLLAKVSPCGRDKRKPSKLGNLAYPSLVLYLYSGLLSRCAEPNKRRPGAYILAWKPWLRHMQLSHQPCRRHMRSVGAVPLRTEQMCCRTDRGFGLRGCGLAGFQAVCGRLEYLGIHACPVKSERAGEQGAVSFIQKCSAGMNVSCMFVYVIMFYFFLALIVCNHCCVPRCSLSIFCVVSHRQVMIS